MRDKYNLNTAPIEDEGLAASSTASSSGPGSVNANLEPLGGSNASQSATFIPGMAPEDRIEGGAPVSTSLGSSYASVESYASTIPGLDSGDTEVSGEKKKTPYAKPIPRNFQASWSGAGPPPEGPLMNRMPPPQNYRAMGPPLPMLGQPGQMQAPPMRPDNAISLQELQRQATAVVAFGNVYPVLPGSNLFMSILSGERAVKEVIRAEFRPS